MTKPPSYYDRLVDVMEDLVRITILTRPHAQFLVERHSERKAAGIVIGPADYVSLTAY